MNFEEVVNILSSNVLPKTFKKINSCEALNYVISENINSPINAPSVRTSMRDGYGIVFDIENLNNSLQISKEFNVINKSFAGHSLRYLCEEFLNK